ncbi:MAG: 50S ribosomal protein L32 [Candidatus Dependentiae bacterium]|jgi:large subunit ribosomal protein L32
MPVPKGKRSRARRDKRKANKGITMSQLGSCQTCQSPISSHRACSVCGYYKGVKVLRTKTERRELRGQMMQARQGAAGAPAAE